MDAVKVYLVGDKNSEKTNSWLAMTNCANKAAELLAEMEGATSLRIINVKENANAATNNG